MIRLFCSSVWCNQTKGNNFIALKIIWPLFVWYYFGYLTYLFNFFQIIIRLSQSLTAIESSSKTSLQVMITTELIISVISKLGSKFNVIEGLKSVRYLISVVNTNHYNCQMCGSQIIAVYHTEYERPRCYEHLT